MTVRTAGPGDRPGRGVGSILVGVGYTSTIRLSIVVTPGSAGELPRP